MSEQGTTHRQRMRAVLSRWTARLAHRFAGLGEAVAEILFFWR